LLKKVIKRKKPCNYLKYTDINGMSRFFEQKFENSIMRLTRGSGQLNLRTSETVSRFKFKCPPPLVVNKLLLSFQISVEVKIRFLQVIFLLARRVNSALADFRF
jgi:hypothetical protein